MSIVTPVLNRVDTMARCLASIAAQTHTEIEHIVVDGGSTDGTIEMLEQANPRHRMRFISGSDTGMYDAINKGLAMAEGDVLTYLNSDDLFFPWTLETAVRTIRDGADLAFGDLAISTRRPNGTPYVYLQFYPDFDPAWYVHSATLAQPTLAWKRSVNDDLGGFDDTYRLLGDCDYWLRAASAGHRLVHTGDFQAVQLDHDDTLRVTQSERLAQEFTRLRTQHLGLGGPAPDPRAARLRKSVLWRREQLRLFAEVGRGEPRRWRRFISFLEAHDVDVDRKRLLAFQLPERLRPDLAGWVDPDLFDKALDDALAAASA